jgi:hypothetical protein
MRNLASLYLFLWIKHTKSHQTQPNSLSFLTQNPLPNKFRTIHTKMRFFPCDFSLQTAKVAFSHNINQLVEGLFRVDVIVVGGDCVQSHWVERNAVGSSVLKMRSDKGHCGVMFLWLMEFNVGFFEVFWNEKLKKIAFLRWKFNFV